MMSESLRLVGTRWMSESLRLVNGIGDANAERLYRAEITVTRSQLDAAVGLLMELRRDIVNRMQVSGPNVEDSLTRALAVHAALCGQFAEQLRGSAEVLPPVRVRQRRVA